MIVKHLQDEILGYLKDASNMPGGHAERVFFPESEEELASLLADCHRDGTPVTVSGAGTGLAGGRVPFGGAVVSTSKLNAIVSIDPEANRARVEPGVILAELQREVEAHDRLYPPDPTERNCFIGGSVATNASGARTFKYGPTRNYVTALKLLLGSGERLHLRRGQTIADGRALRLHTVEGRAIEIELPSYTMPAIKHAAGYFAKPGMDAIDLFIGSEGTLGVITEIELKLIPLPRKLFSGIIFFPSEELTLAFVDEARAASFGTRSGSGDTGIDARALEFLDADSLELIRPRFPSIPSGATGGAVWFEQEATEENEEELLATWYDLMLRHGALVDESWFAISAEDQRRMREFRHAVPSAVYEQISEGNQTKLGTDMAVPDAGFHELLRFYRQEFAANRLRTVVYGHIGNNHLHANIFASGADEFAAAKGVYNRLVEKVLALGGTISAEHGVGKLKKAYLEAMYGPEGIEGMRRIKRALDPAGILGRNTMFDPEPTDS
jgi:D-lactate dehydrogenase (cytochrome)